MTSLPYQVQWAAGEGGQAKIIEAARSNPQAIKHAFIKFDTGWFGCFRRWSESFFLRILDIVPPISNPPEQHNRLFCFVPPDEPQQFFLDIESYAPALQPGEEPQVEAALELVLRTCNIVAGLMNDIDLHECEEDHFYISECCRPSGEYFKYSFHVIFRCSQGCYFKNFEQMGLFARHLKDRFDQLHDSGRHNHFWPIDARTNEPTCIIDWTVYTRARAFRLPLCAKDDHSRPLTVVGFQLYRSAPIDHLMFVKHVHGYVDQTNGPYQDIEVDKDVSHVRMSNNATLRGRKRTTAVANPAAAVVPAQIITFRDRLAVILSRLGFDHLGVSDNLHIGAPGLGGDEIFEFLLRRDFNPAQVAALKPYKECWYRVCSYLVQFVEDRALGRELWMHVAAQVPKSPEDKPDLQWDREVRHRQSRTLVDPHVARFRLAAIRHICRLLGIPFESIQNRSAPSLCPVCLFHHSDITVTLAPNDYDAIILRCGNNYRFYGHWYEYDSLDIANTRYVSDNPSIRRQLVLAVANPRSTQAQRTLVIAYGMGCGKTVATHELGKNLGSKASILIISMRKILLETQYKIHKKYFDILHYLRDWSRIQEKLSATQIPNVAIVVDSLRKLVFEDGTVPRYDTVVVEEYESILAHLSSETIDHTRRLVCGIFFFLLATARTVIILDADFGRRGFDSLVVRPDATLTIFRSLPKPLAKHHFTYSRGLGAYWLSKLISMALSGYRLFIVSNTKRQLQALASILQRSAEASERTLDIHVITGDSSGSIKRSASDCNDTWPAHDIVMVSPVISSGIDFSRENHFHCVFALWCYWSACIRDLLQQINRVRYPASDEVHILFNAETPEERKLLPDRTPDEQYNHECASIGASLAARALDPVALEAQIEDGRLVIPRTPLVEVLIANKIEAQKSRINPWAVHRYYATIHGDRVTSMTKEDCQESIPVVASMDDVASIAGDILLDESIALANAPRLSESMEVVISDLQHDRDIHDPRSIMKERYCNLLGVNDITDPEIMTWLSQDGFLGKWTTFMLLFDLERQAMDYTDRAFFNLNNHIDNPLSSFFTRRSMFERHAVLYTYEDRKARLVRKLLDHLGLRLDLPHRCHKNQIYEIQPWIIQNLPEIREFFPKSTWESTKRNSQLTERVNKILKLAGLVLDEVGRNHRCLHVVLLNKWLCLSTLQAPELFYKYFGYYGLKPLWFYDEIAAIQRRLTL